MLQFAYTCSYDMWEHPGIPKLWLGIHQWVVTWFLVGRKTDKLVADK